MCGIAGYLLDCETPQESVVRAMCARIRHRGPDDEGIHVERFCGLGMRRLSIIDLATGHQPISNEDGTVWIVFNGEVYNYQPLREWLEKRGHRFRTHSDTETLVHLHEEEGVEGLKRLRGMFAYAIWDRRAQKLTLARDRFGKKPLYYAQVRGAFYFASELKSILTATGPLEIDAEALRMYLQFGYIPDPWTPFREVRKLPAASWLQMEPGGRMREGRYWRMPEPVEHAPAGYTRERAIEEIRAVFDESVKLRMIADVPLGAFLSGGIDSSLVVASMARQSSSPIRTFSIGWEEPSYNELGYASAAARHYATDHREMMVRPDAIALVPKLVEFLDEPFADASAIPTYLVSQFAAGHVKVVLSGDGGDELFGGYHSFFMTERFRYADRVPRFCRKALAGVAKALPASAYGKNYLYAVSRPTSMERYLEYGCFSGYFGRSRVIARDWMTESGPLRLGEIFDGAVLAEGRDPLSQAMHFEATAKLTGDILTKVDRMSMANSLEVRCPLLDHELAEVAGKIPNAWKTRDGKGKLILLEALGDRLPRQLLNRNKMGFGVPLHDWFRGPLREMLRDHLLSSGFLDRGIVNRAGLEAVMAEHDRARRNHSDYLWLLLVLELWLRNHAACASAAELVSAS
jgi:asparagine synthase (glutamine-hydrolysing)